MFSHNRFDRFLVKLNISWLVNRSTIAIVFLLICYGSKTDTGSVTYSCTGFTHGKIDKGECSCADICMEA